MTRRRSTRPRLSTLNSPLPGEALAELDMMQGQIDLTEAALHRALGKLGVEQRAREVDDTPETKSAFAENSASHKGLLV